ncbi:MAG: hypothetical protein M1827_001449 [Pycnora praestabilis]|nr:MAG: hypothetical protein M1827_001449 [Pycnora praestabilis]
MSTKLPNIELNNNGLRSSRPRLESSRARQPQLRQKSSRRAGDDAKLCAAHLADRLADYEDELRSLKSSHSDPPPQPTGIVTLGPISEHSPLPSPTGIGSEIYPPTIAASAGKPSSLLPVQNRLSSFLISRKSINNATASPSAPSPSPSASDLQAALDREQTLRRQAEGQLTQANGELEELSAQLFQQANEMVATERRARAKLEERVELLEKRDGEKRKRLERLEGALKRIERVRGLLGP